MPRCARYAVFAATVAATALAQAPASAAERVIYREAPARGRVDASYAVTVLGTRQVVGGLETTLNGLAPLQLRLAAAYLVDRLPIGVAVDGAYERFAVIGPNLLGTEQTLRLSGFRGSGAVAARWVSSRGWSVEGHLGYGFAEIPTVDFSTGEAKGSAIRQHGPLIVALFGYDPGGWVAARLKLRTMPLPVRATSGLDAVSAFDLTAGADVAFGRLAAAGLRWSTLVSYELDLSSAANSSLTLTAASHRIAIGVRVRVPDPEPLVIHLPPPTGPGSIRGTVTFGDTLKPAPTATVEIPGLGPLTIDPAGAFQVASIGPGAVTLQARSAGYKATTQTVTVPAEETVDVAIALNRPTGPGVIKGVVKIVANPKAPEAGPPAAGIAVEAVGAAPVTTGADGAFAFPSAGPGPVTVTIKARGYKPVEEVVAVPAEGEAKIELFLIKLGVKALAQVRGQVRSVAGKAVPATLKIPEAQLVTHAGDDGRFNIRVPGGKYTVVIEAPGFVSQSKVVEVADGDQAIFHFDLSPAER